ncbi:MAG: hypothetical protein HGA45_32015 [Chloroflexales bacterium]|nr:hypothetical protein [Chloroflexales bacterium]
MIGSLLMYMLCCVPLLTIPLVIGLRVLRTDIRSATVAFAGWMTLKPLAATPLWLILIFLFDPRTYHTVSWAIYTLIAMIPAVSLTVALLWAHRAMLREGHPLAIACLLAADTLRWMSSVSIDFVNATAEQPEAIVPLLFMLAASMPTIFALVAWVIVSVISERERQRSAP